MSDEFDKALEQAHHVLCGDREGTFNCHTVDPYVDALEKAHRAEICELQAKLDRIRKLVDVQTPRIHTPWWSRGGHVFDGEDYGDLVATFEDVDSSPVAEQTALAVNRFAEVRKLLCGREDEVEEADRGYASKALAHAEKIGVYEYKVNGKVMEYWSFFGRGEGWYFIRHDLEQGKDIFRGANIPWDDSMDQPIPAFLRGPAGTAYNYMEG